ncbi:MAG: DUF4142 domain-containing protein [Methylotenera sp.]|uniref:DUF4142 domain-containing protein n=1 Tax=Methylotenera sp. TaxID=2051956 RepID=UPI0024891112|nr:DUF4142 domain-containing protein [Methylotenera sp.]MDI1309874.1 DUF4142 domain-containing protein [Methylotenera sp.]
MSKFKPSFVAVGLLFVSSALFNTNVLADNVSGNDKSFMKNAAQSGHYEIEASKLALSRSSSQEVKDFAQHIIEDHQKAAKELQAIATKKGVELPTKPSLLQMTSIKMLQTHKGTDFDESYAEKVGVDAHKSAIDEFSKASEKSDDSEIKAFAAKTLPTLKKHLEMATVLEKKTDERD